MRRIAAVVLASMILLSCPSPLDRDTVGGRTVVVGISLAGSTSSRTVVPDFSSALTSVKKLEATLTSDDALTTFSDSDSDGAPWDITVPKGTWDLKIVLYDAADKKIGEGELKKLTVTAARIVEVPITFTPIPNTKGTVSFKVSFPDALGINYLHGQIVGGSSQAPTLTPLEGITTGTFSFDNLDTGTYPLVLTFKRGGDTGTVAGIFRETIVVVGGYESKCWVNADGNPVDGRTFVTDDFLVNETSLTGLAFTQTTLLSLGFSPSTRTYNLGPITGFAADAKIRFIAGGASDGRALKYRWNGGAPTEIAAGTESEDLAVADCNELFLQITAPDRATMDSYRVIFSKPFPDDGGPYSFPAQGGSANFTLSSGEITITSCSTGITSVDIPAYIGGHKVTKIADNAFMDRTSLTTINLPDSITSIGDHAFLRCSSLTSFVIPDSVTTISEGSIQDLTSMTSVVIPSKVETIELYAFYNDTALQSIDLPASLKTIGIYAFHGSRSLTIVHVRATEPPSLGVEAFTGTLPPSRTIYVPKDSESKYESATGWKNFGANFIVGE